MEQAGEDLQQLAQRLARVHPRRQLDERSQYLDDLQSSLLRCVKHGWRNHRVAWEYAQQRLFRLRPALLVAQCRQNLRELQRRLQERSRHVLQSPKNSLANLEARLRLLSPGNVLARGYSLTTDAASGKIIRASGEVQLGQKLKTKLHSGDIRSTVEE